MKQFYNSVVLHVTQLLQRLGDSACVHAGVCTCTCGSCLYGLLMAVEFFNLQSHTSENYCACLSLKLMKGAFQPLWEQKAGGNRRCDLGGGRAGPAAAERDQDPHGMWGLGRQLDGRGEEGAGVHEHVQVSPHCPSGAAAREAEPCQARAARLHGIHAALQTRAWKLWVTKVPVVCFCCIQRNKILSTCFVNKPKTFLTPIINFSS